jgi:probable HAF family extracellular repeat protein
MNSIIKRIATCVAVAVSITAYAANAAFFTSLGDLPGGDFFSAAKSVSANGSVVVGESRSTFGTEAFRWTSDGGMLGLGDLPGLDFYSQAQGISADGTIVVGRSYSDNETEPFRWSQSSGMVGLGHLPGGRSPSWAERP